VPQRLLLFAATTGYQIRVFADAARRLGVEATLAADRCNRLDDPWGDHSIAVKFDYRMPQSVETFRGMRFDGVAAVGDRPAVLAAEAAEMLGIPFHPPAAAYACQDKYLARQLYQAAGLPVPALFPRGADGRCRRAGLPRAIPLRAEAAGPFRQPRRDPRQQPG
jgi:glutathione synthase/RimK-type ligase-like ATP-grasp enzyme